jgi:small subunit ribosomal protein S8
MMTDPIADLLARIRNAARARHERVEIPWSRLKEQVARVMGTEGYVAEVAVTGEGKDKRLCVTLRYDKGRGSVISGLRRVSTPGLRVYAGAAEIPKVQDGLGISILSTSKGVLVDREARRLGVGGEVLVSVW